MPTGVVLADQTTEADTNIPEIIVSARLRERADRSGQSVTYLQPEDFDASASRLDEALGRVPGVSLFRRATSLTAHPTIQGVTIRGIGASGAGRTLVMVDGVPQNDPFGGWVYWSALSKGGIDGITIVRGAGGTRWGSQALAGVIDIRSSGELDVTAGFRYGSFDTKQGYVRGGTAIGAGSLVFEASGFDTDGPWVVAADQRGTVDVRAASDAWNVSAAVAMPLGDIAATLRVKRFSEKRVNGLSLSTNETDATDVSLTLGPVDSAQWGATLWYKDRDFSNVFVSARDERTTERPVLDQHDVPAEGFGANLFTTIDLDSVSVEVGGDVRHNTGETNELSRNLGGGFTRGRRAGGEQLLGGIYVDAVSTGDATRLSAAVRLDYWEVSKGERREWDLADGTVLRDDDLADRNGTSLNGRLGVTHDLTGAVTGRVNAYSGYRLPTLNEFYRPFRVVNDITEANPDLLPEKVYGLDIGIDFEPLNTLRGSVTLYRNWLRQGVGNVTLAVGPGFFPPTGFVPGGGVLRQRQNIDRIVVDGIELEGEADLASKVSLTLRYLYSKARVTKFDDSPDLVGKRLAQVPKHVLVAALDWQPSSAFNANVALRYRGGQFDDDLNTRWLEDAATVDASLTYQVAEGVEAFVAARNLFDKTIISAISGLGLETLADPRQLSIGINLRM